jgi:L-arabinokinase
VENCVVGAPCGVMDQMAASLGEAGSLLALRCQPAEVLPPVSLPPHIRLWGIDSGIRHRYWPFLLQAPSEPPCMHSPL